MPGKRSWRSTPRNVPHVEIDGLGAAVRGDALAGDGAGHHIARSELKQGVVALHEPLAVMVAQICAFAAERFRQQKARSARKRQRGGMKLVELHVGQFGARCRGKGDAVAGGYGGIGGVRVDLACSTRSDEDSAGGDAMECTLPERSGQGGHPQDRRRRPGLLRQRGP